MTPYEEFPWGPGLSVNEAFDCNSECKHGRLPFDHTPPCGCWTPWAEGLFGAKVVVLKQPAKPEKRRAA